MLFGIRIGICYVMYPYSFDPRLMPKVGEKGPGFSHLCIWHNSLASLTHLRKRREGFGELRIQAVSRWHSTVRYNHIAIFCHMMHYVTV